MFSAIETVGTPISDAIDGIDCGQPIQKFTISTYQSWIDKHNQYAKHFTRSQDNGRIQPSVYADFEDMVEAYELYSALNALGVPVFKNFMT